MGDGIHPRPVLENWPQPASPREEIQESIIRLANLGRARRLLLEDERYYVSISLSASRHFQIGRSGWEPSVQCTLGFARRDTLGDRVLSSCGVVLLAAIVGGTRGRGFSIARATILPVEFAMLVLGMAERQRVLSLDSAFDLQQTIRGAGPWFPREIEQRLHDLKEDLWEFCWTPGIEAELHTFRKGRQFGGAVDRWVDQEALDKATGFVM